MFKKIVKKKNEYFKIVYIYTKTNPLSIVKNIWYFLLIIPFFSPCFILYLI